VAVTSDATSIAAGEPETFDARLIDSRGMRKLKANDVLVPVFEGFQATATTGTSINLTYSLRMQFKL